MSTGVDLKHIMLSEKKPYVKSLQSTLWYSHNILEWAKLMEKYQKVYCLWWDEVELTEKSHGAAFWNDFVVQSLSCVQVFATPWTTACQASLSFTNSQSFLKLMSIELVMLSNHLIYCHPLLLLPSIFPSIRVFSTESAFSIRWPKYWSSSFSISPSDEYSRLISFRIDWLDPLTVQGTLKSLPQHYSSKASVLQRSAFFMVQLSYPNMTPGKTNTYIETWLLVVFNYTTFVIQLNVLYNKMNHI